MAGIGFSLNKILRNESLTGVIAAYSVSGIISSTPWIVSILSIMILGIFLSYTPTSHESVMQFQITISYLVAGSLITSGFAQNSFSRYVSDQLFVNKSTSVIPNFNGMMLIVTLIAGCMSFTLLLLAFPQQSILYRFLFMGSFVTLCNLWLVVNLLTGLKDYQMLIKAFVISYAFILMLGYILKTLGLEGLMLAYFIGQFLLISILIGALYKQYPTNQIIAFHFLEHKQMYKLLMLSGFLFNLGIWIDKLVFWYSPSTSYAIIGPIRGSLFYDVPIFIAYLTVVPGMGVLLFLMETNFSEYYERFHEAIRNGKSLSYIQTMKEQMTSHAYHIIYSIIKVQAVIIIIMFQAGDRVLQFFNLSTIYKNLLFVDVIGTSLQVVFIAILSLLFYMDKRKDCFLLTTLFVLLNLTLSILTIYLGPFYYGFGFTVALIFTCIYGMHCLDETFTNLEYKIIMLRK